MSLNQSLAFVNKPKRGVDTDHSSCTMSRSWKQTNCSKLSLLKNHSEAVVQSVISLKLQSNFIEIKLRHGCCPVNLLHIFRTHSTKNNSGQRDSLLYLFVLGDCF